MIPLRRTRSYRRSGVNLVRKLLTAAGRLPAFAAGALVALTPCPMCGRAAPGSVACTSCTDDLIAALDATPVAGDRLWLGPYAGPLLRMVHALKFGGQRGMADYLGRLIARQVDRAAWPIECVGWVPASSRKLRTRGFDQAELLARAVASELGAAHRSLITRSAPGTGRGSQAALGRDARSLNAAGAFLAGRVHGARVLLVDDVTTTGATLDACRTALARAGAAAVFTAVVARTVRSEADLLEHDDDGGQHP